MLPPQASCWTGTQRWTRHLFCFQQLMIWWKRKQVNRQSLYLYWRYIKDLGGHMSGGQLLSQPRGRTSHGEIPDMSPKVNEEKLDLRWSWTEWERIFQPEGAACSKARMWEREKMVPVGVQVVPCDWVGECGGRSWQGVQPQREEAVSKAWLSH